MKKIPMIVTVVMITVLLGVSCRTVPTPVEELVTEPRGAEAMAIPERSDGSAESATAPRVLILGTVHLANQDRGYTKQAFARVRDSLADFEPDMVVVEQLPSDWPTGKGRDYRPGFDLEHYAESWDLSQEAASEILRRHRAEPFSPDRCLLGRAYFLKRDLANAAYHWLSSERSGGACPNPSQSKEIRDWLRDHAQSEYARLGYRIADRMELPEVVSYDYQGEDAQWFLGPSRFVRDLVPFSDVSEANAEVDLHVQPHLDRLGSMLRFANSPEWIGLQYWVYEQRHLDVERNDMGVRQVENFWLRNRKMFENMQNAIEAKNPRRVLVVTGMGHKYFMDTLVMEAGYRWVDPRNYLPQEDVDS